MKGNRLVVADAGWAESIPDWLKQEVKKERLVSGFIDVLDKEEEVGDAEVCVYLYTASLRQPLSSRLTNVQLHISGKLMKKRGTILPPFLEKHASTELAEDEKRELQKLRQKLYRARGGKINHPVFDVLKQLNQSG